MAAKNGPKMVTCVTCNDNKLVSKRSTVSLPDGSGRACRTHPETIAALEEEASKGPAQAGMESIQDMMFVTTIRYDAYRHGGLLFLAQDLYSEKLRKSGYSKKRIDGIMAKVNELGNMTPEEITESLMNAFALEDIISKGKEGRQ